MKVPYGLTIYILLTIYLYRGLNKLCGSTQGERYYGDAVLHYAPWHWGLLHCGERQQLSLPLAGKQAH